jgi:hypothetical protein
MILHIAAIIAVTVLFYTFCIIYSGKDYYEDIKADFYRAFNTDLRMTEMELRDLEGDDVDRAIDQFEYRWKGYVSDRELKRAIGQLIQTSHSWV